MKSTLKQHFGMIIAATLVMGLIAVPESLKTYYPASAVSTWIQAQKLHLGLDLQGGTQLDYRMDLRQAQKYNADADKTNDVNIAQLIEGVRLTIERRVNGLGVSEPRIYTSDIAGENHIIVELAGIKDIEAAKKTVGKTIQLEFKEQKTELDPNEKENVKKDALKALAEAKTASDFIQFGEKTKSPDGKIEWIASKKVYKDELPVAFGDKVWNAAVGTLIPDLIETDDGFAIDASGNSQKKTGLAIVKVLGKKEVERTKTEKGETFAVVAKSLGNDEKSIKLGLVKESALPDVKIKALPVNGPEKKSVSEPMEKDGQIMAFHLVNKVEHQEKVRASHILIQYQGSERSTATRSKADAAKLARELYDRIQKGESFDTLVKEYTEEPGGKDRVGDLGFFGKGQMVPEFEKVAFALPEGQILGPVETAFGFHVIKRTGTEKAGETEYDLEKISVSTASATAKLDLSKALDRLSDKQVKATEPQLEYQQIFFSTVPDGWKTTGLDGSHFKRASVSFSDVGMPYVAIQFDSEGGKMFEDLTGRNVGKPVAIFVGGQLISAPKVNEKISGGSAQITGRYTIKEAADLATDLNTGAIPAPIDLVGQYTIGATLGAEALHTSVIAGLIGVLLLVLSLTVYYRVLGLVASLALAIYSVILLFILKTSGVIGMPIVLTLAGIAGIILSIGMAVDANILIFERIKEELRDGKNLSAALAIGFERAWTSIRDSNVSSLITCVILAWFGSSIIRGFAINLAIGILVSMFTAITVTRTLIGVFITENMAKSAWLLGKLKR